MCVCVYVCVCIHIYKWNSKNISIVQNKMAREEQRNENQRRNRKQTF